MKKITVIILLFLNLNIFGDITNVGTTAANFLEIGIGSAGPGMGNAYTAYCKDPSALYWNPAGLAFLKTYNFMFMNSPWLADINLNYIAAGLPIPNVGVLGFDLTYLGTGDMLVRTVAHQQGTGQKFSANDLEFGIGFARFITDWFSFGFNAKYIKEKIYQMSASALAFNFGVHIQTDFFSVTGKKKDGLIIAMSISNYGTKMRLDGINTLIPVDIDPNIEGNYDKIAANMRTEDYPLPLIYRIGIGYSPIISEYFRINFAIDAIHPNNSSEYINAGTEAISNINPYTKLFLRAGYSKLFLKNSEEGLTFGAGIQILYNKVHFGFNYSYSAFNRLKYVNRFTFNFFF